MTILSQQLILQERATHKYFMNIVELLVSLAMPAHDVLIN